jgi:hypothetical protein
LSTQASNFPHSTFDKQEVPGKQIVPATNSRGSGHFNDQLLLHIPSLEQYSKDGQSLSFSHTMSGMQILIEGSQLKPL